MVPKSPLLPKTLGVLWLARLRHKLTRLFFKRGASLLGKDVYLLEFYARILYLLEILES